MLFFCNKIGKKRFLPHFENFDRNYRILGRGIAKIRLQIWTLHVRSRLYANFGQSEK